MPIPAGMLEIFATVAPIFLIVCVGFGAVRGGIVSRDGVKGMAAFLVNIAMPALVFGAISSRSLADVMDGNFLFAYGGGSLTIFVAMLALSLTVLGRQLTGASIYSVGSSLSNTLMVGFPTATALLGAAALPAFAMVLLVENLVMLPLALIIADAGRGPAGGLAAALKRIWHSVLKNPLVLAIVLGVLVSAAPISPPDAVMTALDLLGRAVAGMGLFIVGGMLVGFRYSGNLRDVSCVVLAKLLLHPAAVLLIFLVLPAAEPEMMIAGVTMAAAPVFGASVAIAERYGLGSIAAAVVAPATVLSFLSMSLLILLATSIWGG